MRDRARFLGLALLLIVAGHAPRLGAQGAPPSSSRGGGAAPAPGPTPAGPPRAEIGSPPEPPSDPDRASRAASLFREGTSLYLQGRVEAAYRAFGAAWALEPSYEIAANLAVTELALARFRDAAEHLAYARRHLPADADPAAASGLEMRLARARAEVGELSITASVEGAEIAVDGAPVGRAPLASALFVEPGEHVVEARAQGRRPARRAIAVAKGSSLAIDLELAELPARPTGGADGVTARPPAATGTAKSAPLLIGGVAGALTLAGAGTVTLLIANGKAREAEALGASLGSAGRDAESLCAAPPPGYADDCEAFATKSGRAGAFSAVAVGSFAAASALAIGTAVYALWPEAKGPAVQLGPMTGPRTSGIALRGRF